MTEDIPSKVPSFGFISGASERLSDAPTNGVTPFSSDSFVVLYYT